VSGTKRTGLGSRRWTQAANCGSYHQKEMWGRSYVRKKKTKKPKDQGDKRGHEIEKAKRGVFSKGKVRKNEKTATTKPLTNLPQSKEGTRA